MSLWGHRLAPSAEPRWRDPRVDHWELPNRSRSRRRLFRPGTLRFQVLRRCAPTSHPDIGQAAHASIAPHLHVHTTLLHCETRGGVHQRKRQLAARRPTLESGAQPPCLQRTRAPRGPARRSQVAWVHPQIHALAHDAVSPEPLRSDFQPVGERCYRDERRRVGARFRRQVPLPSLRQCYIGGAT